MSVPSFEGFLRPETYILPADVSARELVRIMATGFRTEWRPGWDARLDSLRMDRLDLVTLASIVEGEARVDEERETIAGVYHNRLAIGSPVALGTAALPSFSAAPSNDSLLVNVGVAVVVIVSRPPRTPSTSGVITPV